MNAILRLAMLFALVGPACAAEPPALGKVLLIDDDRLLEGDIARIGERYRIRGGDGEMSIPATPTMRVFADKAAAYQHVRSKARLTDVLERVRLARWCVANQLLPQAVTEAEAALALKPGDRSVKQFAEQVKLRATLAPPPSLTATKPAEPAPAAEPATADVHPESFSLFVTKVQPLLLNACGQCHCGERSGPFKMTWTASTFGDKRATQMNLTAVSRFLNREQPSASPLLLRAVTVHGETPRPPLKDRQSPAFKYLEEWARLATGRPLTPAAPAPLPSDAIAAAQPLAPAMPAEAKDGPPVVVLPALGGGSTVGDGVIHAKGTEITPVPASPKPEAKDPFDPEIFNRQAPPKK